MLFALLMSGLERHLSADYASVIAHVGSVPRPTVSYADDFKLFARHIPGMLELLAATREYLRMLGLSLDVSATGKCKLLCIRRPRGAPRQLLPVPGGFVRVVSELRFLGVKVTNRATIATWRDDNSPDSNPATGTAAAVCRKLDALGLGSSPGALAHGASVRIVPAILYGSEVWGIPTLHSTVLGRASPYLVDHFAKLLCLLRARCGLDV